MVNEDIVTALRNAVNSGESLELAINTLINSGYDSQDVIEASQFVAGMSGTMINLRSEQIPINQSYPQQILSSQAIPESKQIQQQIAIQSQQPQQAPQKIQQTKKSYFKEIILIIILIFLLGALVVTIFFRDKILGFFS